MVGEGDVFVSALLGRPRHPLELVGAIAPRAVHLEVSPQVLGLDEVREPPLPRGLALPPRLSQLRRYERQPELLVDLRLALPPDPLSRLHVEEPVLVQLPPSLD